VEIFFSQARRPNIRSAASRSFPACIRSQPHAAQRKTKRNAESSAELKIFQASSSSESCSPMDPPIKLVTCPASLSHSDLASRPKFAHAGMKGAKVEFDQRRMCLEIGRAVRVVGRPKTGRNSKLPDGQPHTLSIVKRRHAVSGLQTGG